MESGDGAEGCPYRLVKGSAGSNLRCDCGDCPRGANLKDARCLPRVLRTLDRNYGISSITLSHFVEAQYTGDSMRALERMLAVKRLLDRMATRSPGPGGRPLSDCGGCALNPGMMFNTLTGLFMSDQAKFHDAYLKAAILLNQGRGPACRECLDKTKGDFVFLGGQLVPFWRFLQGRGRE